MRLTAGKRGISGCFKYYTGWSMKRLSKAVRVLNFRMRQKNGENPIVFRKYAAVTVSIE